jgi:hypothetical protein
MDNTGKDHDDKRSNILKNVALQTHSSTYSHSYLYYNAIVKYHNHICILDSTQSMCNNKNRSTLAYIV